MDRAAITAIFASVFMTVYTGCSLVLHYDPVTLLKFPDSVSIVLQTLRSLKVVFKLMLQYYWDYYAVIIQYLTVLCR